jgi:hypothetical protein
MLAIQLLGYFSTDGTGPYPFVAYVTGQGNTADGLVIVHAKFGAPTLHGFTAGEQSSHVAVRSGILRGTAGQLSEHWEEQ